RMDDLNWNIGLKPTPNVLSELTWRDLEINQTQTGFTLHNQKVLFKGEFRYGQIEEGENQDSDYLGDNRTDEFIRSYSKTAGETVDGSFAMGYRLTTPTARFTSTVTPLIGFAKHKQYLQMIEGRRTLNARIPDPAPVPLNGLNSRGIELNLCPLS
ncbi:MAG: hypothetical protein FD130_2501, partial [Halothiobacillaceae bacterium]